MEGLCRGVKFEAWKVRFLREQEPEVPCEKGQSTNLDSFSPFFPSGNIRPIWRVKSIQTTDLLADVCPAVEAEQFRDPSFC